MEENQVKSLAKFSEQSYALLRIVSGVLFAVHGMQKIFGILAEAPKAFGTQLWFGGLIELVGGLLIAIGLKTRWAAFLCSGMMAVAYLQFHWKFQFGPEFFPVINRGELALIYAFLFLYIACRGGGIWAIDKED
jgi:putative oxidoreductase